MAVLHQSSSNRMLSLKAVLISSAVVSMAVVLKLFVPLMFEFAVSGVPVMWSTLLSWLKPPYLYVVINGIILTIAASSRLCQKLDEDNPSQSQAMVMGESRSEFVYEAKTVEISPEFGYEAKTVEITPEFGYEAKTVEISPEFGYEVKMPIAISPEFGYEAKTVEISPEFGYEVKMPIAISPDFVLPEMPAAVVYEQSEGIVSEVKTVVTDSKPEDAEDEFVISRSNWSPMKRMDSSEISLENLLPGEKPLVSARFSHRKPVKASPEGGKALRVTKPKRQETFESTWKTITDGRHVPLTRHLRKSDTFENQSRQVSVIPQDRNVIKAQTFKDRTNNPPPPVTSSPGLGKLRKEPSLSQDDLNRRVEAFINKFNEEMRLQRQESLNQYKEMINRGAYS